VHVAAGSKATESCGVPMAGHDPGTNRAPRARKLALDRDVTQYLGADLCRRDDDQGQRHYGRV
jgi:hypothetical protein